MQGSDILGKLSRQLSALIGGSRLSPAKVRQGKSETEHSADRASRPQSPSSERPRGSETGHGDVEEDDSGFHGGVAPVADRKVRRRGHRRSTPARQADSAVHGERSGRPADRRRGRRHKGPPPNGAPPRSMVGRSAPVEVADVAPGWRPTGRFGELSVSEPVERALAAMGYDKPSPIQSLVVPHMLEGRDLVGQAQTGTGKTTAFGIPIVESLKDDRAVPGRPGAVVLCPTRELAIQVTGELTRLGAPAGLRVVTVYGGQAMNVQLDALGRGAHVVVATPGRLIDHMERGTIGLDRVRIVILDEADQMLDIGFAEDIERILRRTPKSRQTALFSATMPGPIKYLSRRYLNRPEWCRVGEESQAVDEVEQLYFEVAAQDRQQALKELLKDPAEVTQALIFRRTKMGVDRLVSFLRRLDYDADAIHGDMTQAHRERVMGRFRNKKLRILIATNVAARGLDIPAVSHVVNYDMPDNLEEYIHRIGRTARMGREGTAYLFVSDLADFDMLETIRDHVGKDQITKSRLEFLYGL